MSSRECGGRTGYPEDSQIPVRESGKLVGADRLKSGVVIGQVDGLDHHADEIGPPRLAGPLRCDESDRRPLTSKQTEETRDECLRREAPWVLSREGELKGIDGLCLWIGPPRNEAGELSVEASRKEVDCVSTPLPIGLTKEIRVELEICGVLPPLAELADRLAGSRSRGGGQLGV